GMNQVKETMINILTQEYESFMMKDNESISEIFDKFQKIISTLKNLGEKITKPRQVKETIDPDVNLWVMWPVAGRVPSRCLRPATLAPPVVVPAVGRYRVVSERSR
ncbi:hypothetical protein ACLOJK_022586, partial [Asimina triloba]